MSCCQPSVTEVQMSKMAVARLRDSCRLCNDATSVGLNALTDANLNVDVPA
eukprot:m.101403 g.101403  ORF g.101403 m.101403 type:complete len:51 (-) comp15165_c0_seq3:230-382(-)